MILFWVICAVLILIALAFVLPPALQQSEEADVKSDDERKQANIAVYRDQLSELEADLRNGIVAEEQYAQDREEIERRLLEDTAQTRSKKTPACASECTKYCLSARASEFHSSQSSFISKLASLTVIDESCSGRSASCRNYSSTAGTFAGTNRSQRREAGGETSVESE